MLWLPFSKIIGQKLNIEAFLAAKKHFLSFFKKLSPFLNFFPVVKSRLFERVLPFWPFGRAIFRLFSPFSLFLPYFSPLFSPNFQPNLYSERKLYTHNESVGRLTESWLCFGAGFESEARPIKNHSKLSKREKSNQVTQVFWSLTRRERKRLKMAKIEKNQESWKFSTK